MWFEEECQKLVTSEDYSALAIYQDPGYAQFRTRVVQYAKGLEVKAKPRLTKDLQEVLDPQIQKIQTSDLMMKLILVLINSAISFWITSKKAEPFREGNKEI